MAESTAIGTQILPSTIAYIQYGHELEAEYLPAIRALISKDLSEPYSIYVYRYFLYQWSHLCFLAVDLKDTKLIGVIIGKLEMHSSHSPPTKRGYIAMLAVDSECRGRGIATALVRRAIDTMVSRDANEVVLETEETNTAAMRLYERLGFIRSKKLHRYYLNGSSAYRLVLPFQRSRTDHDTILEVGAQVEDLALDEHERLNDWRGDKDGQLNLDTSNWVR